MRKVSALVVGLLLAGIACLSQAPARMPLLGVGKYPTAASASITITQNSGQKTSTNVSSDTYSFGSLPVVGHHVILVLTEWRGPGAVTSVADNQGNTYNIDKSQLGGNGGTRLGAVIASAKVATSAGTFTLTITYAQGGTYAQFAVLEVAGLNTTTWLDQTGANTSIATTTSLTVTAGGANAGANALVVAAFGGDSTNGISNPPTGGSGTYTSLYVDQDAAVTGAEGAYKIISTGETSSAVWAFNSSGFGTTGVIATYKP